MCIDLCVIGCVSMVIKIMMILLDGCGDVWFVDLVEWVNLV